MTAKDVKAKAKRLAHKVLDLPDEQVPVISTVDWIRGLFDFNFVASASAYLRSLFPILGWITRYNFGWLTGDFIAGVTVALVLVPQSMSYATLATLPAEYGLYSSFVGVTTYCFFATSKDVSIGPVAVMSLTISQIIKHVQTSHPHKWQGPQIATTHSQGFIVLGIGLLRLGWIVDFIPAPAVSGFMTGSAITIVASQVPGLLGITGFDTRAACYEVIINTLKGLPRTKLDAAFGLIALFFLYAIRISCDFASRKYPRHARAFFFISVMRNAFVMVILTLSSWLYCRHRAVKGKYPIKILGPVPRGFKHIGTPKIDHTLVSALASQLPVATIILLLEHIAISKSFGRINGYKIDPNQELIAIGVTNTVGTCFGAYPATGSFSRSALKSKSGVRTPIAGVFTAIGVIAALYGLTDAFYWIPTAGLSAVIIHAVADLVASPRQIYTYWLVAPLELIIWLAGVLVIIFTTIEIGIYTVIVASLVLLLLRVARPRGTFLGKVTIHSQNKPDSESREVYVPLNPSANVVNPDLQVIPPAPGVILYRFEESYLYPNSSIVNSTLVDYAKKTTRRGRDLTDVTASQRPWNDPGPRRGAVVEDDSHKPLLRAVVLDFSGVAHIDTTGVQALIDTRDELERWVDGPVEFHFATVLSPWIRRALIAGGFGTGDSGSTNVREIAAVVPYREGQRGQTVEESKRPDLESDSDDMRPSRSRKTAVYGEVGAALVPLDTPFFHFDLVGAVRAAESGVMRQLSRSSSTFGEGGYPKTK
ncbi:sulfate permease [Thelephora ganbajun]|uniref:Sulfate permease n=1 Tax=Thelephora ganbajun TaxID=370292 RepID=A0ACB6ZTZ3_THEGA|nr:sulfate permease [Thelephora ganbajun]